MVTATKDIWAILKTVPDPEIPNLSVVDLGIIRDIEENDDGLIVTITPTYSGCPAMDMIEVNIKAVLEDSGYKDVKVNTVLSPAWSTDWISDEGLKKLKESGITPPQGKADKRILQGDFDGIPCPLCESTNTEMISQFGSTACKALFRCKNCGEPFDYFKCH
ncbi:MAG: 1,2-phenylacetyl-CoA epoxidase subunit PaaD [Saprospiraceae bacterium]|nr:1,2-phenylacetyl-CoA epoxidase subunit PaaD [Saprospiraceae bacterium]